MPDDHASPSLERVLELSDAQFSGIADDAQLAELEQILQQHEEARRQYLRYAMIHAQLGILAASLAPGLKQPLPDFPEEQTPSRPRPTRSERGIVPQAWQRLAAISIACVLLVSAALGWRLSGFQETPDASWQSEFALTRHSFAATHYDNRNLPIQSVGAWSDGEFGPTTFHVAQNASAVSLRSGADVRLEGPALFGVHARNSGVLYHGSVHARLNDPEDSFSVLTSNLRIVDLGTEFRVTSLDPDHVRVEVLEGEVDVQSRVRLPMYYWTFDDLERQPESRDLVENLNVVSEPGVKPVLGIVGDGALWFDHTSQAVARIDGGRGDKVGTGGMAFSTGMTIETMMISHWSGEPHDYDEIFRKEDGRFRILLSFQNDGDVGGFADPPLPSGPCLSFGLHIEQQGYRELDMPLDGREGRPAFEDLINGQPHHLAAVYDSFSGLKSLYIDGRLCMQTAYPIGSLILSGGPAVAEIGNYHGAEPFHGVLDEIALYDFALTAEEIADHFRNAARGHSYFGIESDRLQATRWQSVTRLKAGENQTFNATTGLPVN